MIYSHVAALVLGLALGSAGAWRVQTWRYAQQELDRLEQQRETEAMKRQANQGVTDAHRKDAARAVVAAASARAESERLRDEIARLSTDAGTGGGTDAARALGELLGACAAEHQAVAAEADRLAAKVRGLQGFAKVCLAP